MLFARRSFPDFFARRREVADPAALEAEAASGRSGAG
jgi:hypothetical protein